MPRGKPSSASSSGSCALKKTTVQVGNKKRKTGSQLRAMSESTQLYRKREFALLRRRLAEEGFIFVRGVIPREEALEARRTMLAQAYADGNVTGNEAEIDEAVVRRVGPKKVAAAGYCVDGITGSETNERAGIDVKRWEQIGPSQAMQAVYNGEALHRFLRDVFGDAVRPLPKQTFLRLMGDGGTQEHADYYYFKRDTHIFSGRDGQAAMQVSKEYLESQGLFDEKHYSASDFAPSASGAVDKDDVDEDSILRCNICEESFSEEAIGEARVRRLARQDFGVEGEWHCPQCAISPMAVFTVWISLSRLELARRDSILAVCPRTQLLREWDLPRKGQQLPGDFRWDAKHPWVVPAEVDPGDVVLFNIKTVHAATRNQCRPLRYRVSCDTRLQLVPRGWVDEEDEDEDDESERSKVRRFSAQRESDEKSDEDRVSDPDVVVRDARARRARRVLPGKNAVAPLRRSRRLRDQKKRRSSYHQLQVVLDVESDDDAENVSAVRRGMGKMSIS